MASSFANLTLFNSGPHRFSIARCGRLIRGPFETPLDLPYSTDEGRAIELRVLQFGRLVAANNIDLWTIIEAIRAEAEARRTGTLIDHQGKQWTGLSLVTFEPARRIDRGRLFSIAYRCSYLKL